MKKKHKNRRKTENIQKSNKNKLSYKQFIILTIFLVAITIPFFSMPRSSKLDEILSRLDRETDIARTALVVAKEVFPEINVDSYLAELDIMAREARVLMFQGGGNMNDPEYQIRGLNTYFFYYKKYEYDHEDFFGRKATNCFLSGIMDTKKGACFTMPLLYLCLADRLGIPIHGVNIPHHFILRYDDGSYRSNIEITCEGAMAPDYVYVEDFKILEKELQAGVFLKNLSKKQIISNIYEARGSYYERSKNYDKAIRDFEKTVELNPTNSEAWHNLAILYWNHKKDKEARDRCRAKYKELGLNFARKGETQDLEYIESFIRIAKREGKDTAELEALRDKELVRQNKLARRKEEMMWLDAERQRQELMRSNAMHGNKTKKVYQDWRKKYEERQKANRPGPR
ncbi:MAG: tetratricopeptide repeat protein [Planctomycetes bacterium]|nr:tetratricopeptide repeat protein [Planctomycetota bacterium]